MQPGGTYRHTTSATRPPIICSSMNAFLHGLLRDAWSDVETLLRAGEASIEISGAAIGPSAADADPLRSRRAELAADGDPGEPWRQTIKELKTRGA